MLLTRGHRHITPSTASSLVAGSASPSASDAGPSARPAGTPARAPATQSRLAASLTASIEANYDYQLWMDNLYTTYYYTSPVGCPDGHAALDGNDSAAYGASLSASDAKQGFVAAYNPLAAQAGLRQWSDSEF